MAKILEDELLTAAEVSEATRRPIGTLYNMRSRGEGPPSFKVGGKVMYRKSAVIAWIEGQERATRRGGNDPA